MVRGGAAVQAVSKARPLKTEPPSAGPSKGDASKGEVTRRRIVERALELAGRYGLDALTIGDLAQDLGLSKSGLFAHFKSKERLQLEVLDTAAERISARVFEPALRKPRGEARLRGLFELWVKWINAKDSAGGCVYFAAAFEWDDRDGPVRDRLVRWQERLMEGLARIARTAVEAGQFNADHDLDQFVYELHGIMLKYHFEARLTRDRKALARARKALERLLDSART
jgi:AcrR family transcriptional regulator